MQIKVTTIIRSDKAVANNKSRLSICLQADGFSFAVITNEDEIVRMGKVDIALDGSASAQSQMLKEVFAQLDIIPFGFNKARLVVLSEKFAWVPKHLFDPARNRQYLQSVANIEPSVGVYHIEVPWLVSCLVFDALSSTVTAFKLAVPGIDVHCQHSVLTTALWQQKAIEKPTILFHKRDRVGDFEVFYDNHLLFSNSYQSKDEDELIFHGVELMKRFHIETPDMVFAVCGDVNRTLFHRIQHYFPNVSLFSGRPITQPDSLSETIPTYRHILLLS